MRVRNNSSASWFLLCAARDLSARSRVITKSRSINTASVITIAAAISPCSGRSWVNRASIARYLAAVSWCPLGGRRYDCSTALASWEACTRQW